MQTLSQFALAASVFASIMGALVMCVLVFRYGFTIPAPPDAEGGPTPGDVLITRVGHAVAGMCFAATAVLAILGLSLRSPEPNTPPATTAVAPTPVAVVASTKVDVQALELRLAEAESRLARLDGEARSRSARTKEMNQKRAVAQREPRPSGLSVVGVVDDLRATIVQAEKTAVRHLGPDPLGRVSAR